MPEGSTNLAAVPFAVRQHQIQQPLFLVRRLFDEQSAGIARQLQQANAVVHVRFLGATVAFDLPKQPCLLRPPLRRHMIVEGVVDAAVELIEVHRVQPVFEFLVFNLAAMDGLFMLAPLIRVAGFESRPDPLQYLFVEMQTVEQIGECLVEHFLADIFAPTIGIAASAFVGMPRAVVVDVFALFDLGHDRATAFGTGHQTGEGKLVADGMGWDRVSARQDALDALPKLDRYQGLVLALMQLAVPLE